MNNGDCYLESLFNQTYRIAGRSLRPFCLAHMVFLKRIQSPYVVGGETTAKDLILALNVCTAGSFQEIYQNVGRQKISDLWLNKAREEEKFMGYLKDYASLPDTIKAASHDGASPVAVENKLPVELTLPVRLVSQSSYKLEEALFLPLSQLVWMVAGINYIESGETNILSDADDQIIAHMDSLRGQ